MTHLEVSATFTEDEIARAIFDVQINDRSGNEAAFAKFTVANQANANKLLTARAPLLPGGWPITWKKYRHHPQRRY